MSRWLVTVTWPEPLIRTDRVEVEGEDPQNAALMARTLQYWPIGCTFSPRLVAEQPKEEAPCNPS